MGRGRRGSFVSLVERKSGFTLLAQVPDRRATTVCGAITERFATLPKTLCRTATFDNGKEFAEHIRSLIPALIGRRSEKPPSGYWRRQMRNQIHNTRYSQRWQVETVNSMIKRLLDSAPRARTQWNQHREIILRALTLNLMILRRRRVFYRAIPVLISFPSCATQRKTLVPWRWNLKGKTGNARRLLCAWRHSLPVLRQTVVGSGALPVGGCSSAKRLPARRSARDPKRTKHFV